jgi:hypothetical protein
LSKKPDAYQKIVNEWDTAFAAIWKDQVTKAGLNLATA